MTHYEVLGIEKDATQEQIKAAYHTLAKKYHPDVNDAANANAFFRLIQEAYETLNDPQKRSSYDSPKSGPSEYVNYQKDDDDDNNSYHDGYTYEVSTEKPKRNIILFILLIPVKIVALILIPIVAFLSQIFTWITAAIVLISRLYMGICILGIVVLLFQNMAFQYKVTTIIVGLISAFVGYCLPYIVAVAPVALTLVKGYLKKFVFGHASEFDEV